MSTELKKKYFFLSYKEMHVSFLRYYFNPSPPKYFALLVPAKSTSCQKLRDLRTLWTFKDISEDLRMFIIIFGPFWTFFGHLWTSDGHFLRFRTFYEILVI